MLTTDVQRYKKHTETVENTDYLECMKTKVTSKHCTFCGVQINKL